MLCVLDPPAEGKHRPIQLKSLTGRIIHRRRKPAVVRYHHFIKEKQPDEYYYTLQLIYWPWRSEADVLLPNCSHQDAFNARADAVKNNMERFEKVPDDLICAAIQSMFEAHHMSQNDDKQQQVTVEDRFVVLDYDESLLEHTDILGLVDQDVLVADVDRGVVAEVITDLEYQSLVASLNDEQRRIYNDIYAHASQMQNAIVNSSVQPLYMFVSGPGGVGKSHTIRAIRHMLPRILNEKDPNYPVCLVTATTGAAAEQINGNTINSALGLGKSNEDLKPMSAQMRDMLRCRYRYLRYIVINEVSMLSSKHLLNISERLKEITACYSSSYGNISILFFGDLYQLPPVYGSHVFTDDGSKPHLWRDHVVLRELTTVVRQKSRDFIELLCRVRVGNQTVNDVAILQNRIINDNNDMANMLHIYATNAKCDAFNALKLKALFTNVNVLYSFTAIDSTLTPGLKLHKCLIPTSLNSTCGIPSSLDACKGARVMLRANVDISDKLVNGSMGTIVGFVFDSRKLENNAPESSADVRAAAVDAILIEFDNPVAGRQARTKYRKRHGRENEKIPDNFKATPIQRVVVTFPATNRKTVLKRSMFPIVLAWAFTIHKSQGKTLTTAVCDIGRDTKRHQWQCGQAYVTLSRVTTLEGLYLSRFDPDLIKADKRVSEEMDRLRNSTHQLYTFTDDQLKCESESVEEVEIPRKRQRLSSPTQCVDQSQQFFSLSTVLYAGQPIEFSVLEAIHPAIQLHHTPVRTSRDGNCLWHAVSINICGSEEMTQALRSATVTTLLKHRSTFEALRHDINDPTFDSLLRDARTNSAWGNEFHVLALATHLRRDIYQFVSCRKSTNELHHEKTDAQELATLFYSQAAGTRQHIIYKPLETVDADQLAIQILLHQSHFTALLRKNNSAVEFVPSTILLNNPALE
jgi:hypothetical protein